MNTIATIQDLFFCENLPYSPYFVWGDNGVLIPMDPQPLVVRAYYVSSSEDFEKRFETIRLQQAGPYPTRLLGILPSPDGIPYRMGRLFELFNGLKSIPYKTPSGQGGYLHVRQYCSVQTGSWENDTRSDRPGIFATGECGPDSLWQVFRIELDASRRPIFTLAPLRLAHGFPELDLSSIPDDLRRAEIQSQYDELQRSFSGQLYRAVINRAKDVVESVLAFSMELPSKEMLAKTLRKLRSELDQAQSEHRKPRISPLTYHLAEKLRLLHQRTHPDRTISEGSPSLSLALTVVEDLKEILRDLGFTKG